ncbi:LON peptidase substrate-binding domain-containing protein [Microlunatus spumicola]|uniref:LON peptidase substrate-binding domain-containing protein n=1 Tax=Microlunatus spumicola TaxID=81499 RepID=A0ABP6X1Q5_9ACTN
MAMFPLGSVLLPAMPLQLRVFEERYLLMLSELVAAKDARFGVVLIERGFEVGGGDHRFGMGTVADILQVVAEDGVVGLAAQGSTRFEIVEWLDDAPHPRAEVRVLPDLVWDEALEPLLVETEQLVRRTLAEASEFAETGWSPDVELAEDPMDRCWQLAGITPLGDLDRQSLLRVASTEELLHRTAELTRDARVPFSMPWPEDES